MDAATRDLLVHPYVAGEWLANPLGVVTPKLLNDDGMHELMAKGRAGEVRLRAKETVTLGGIDVTNRTANSIMVKKTAKGFVVIDCCLEEQGM